VRIAVQGFMAWMDGHAVNGVSCRLTEIRRGGRELEQRVFLRLDGVEGGSEAILPDPDHAPI